VVVPGYHLGPAEQHQDATYTRTRSERCSPAWTGRTTDTGSSNRDDSGATASACSILHGVELPLCSAESYRGIGGADERFDLPGGGSVNLYFTAGSLSCRRAARRAARGGSFHQSRGRDDDASADSTPAGGAPGAARGDPRQPYEVQAGTMLFEPSRAGLPRSSTRFERGSSALLASAARSACLVDDPAHRVTYGASNSSEHVRRSRERPESPLVSFV